MRTVGPRQAWQGLWGHAKRPKIRGRGFRIIVIAGAAMSLSRAIHVRLQATHHLSTSPPSHGGTTTSRASDLFEATAHSVTAVPNALSGCDKHLASLLPRLGTAQRPRRWRLNRSRRSRSHPRRTENWAPSSSKSHPQSTASLVTGETGASLKVCPQAHWHGAFRATRLIASGWQRIRR